VTIPRFDVFSGLIDKDARWIESIEGLGAAYERIKELAAITPGTYFVFDTVTHKVLAKIDNTHHRLDPHTTKPLSRLKPAKSNIDEVA
jgi:hypothetical protein